VIPDSFHLIFHRASFGDDHEFSGRSGALALPHYSQQQGHNNSSFIL
jgi:hypothetical protein